ncbi:MAG: HEAT repeat domain-containing protein [Prevotella sp.]|nr:HEAT repeat domain-containing protein [Prevotella sp.]
MESNKPANYDELKRQANDSSSWRNRLDAVRKLGGFNEKSVKDILWRRMISDPVYTIQEEAFRKLQALGESVKLPRKKKGNILKDMNKDLQKIKHSLPENHSYEDFKEKLKDTNLPLYDTIEGNKINKTDQFLENIWKSLPKKSKHK